MRRLLTLPLFCLIASGAMAADEVFVADSVAIRGYDPVAYFTAGGSRWPERLCHRTPFPKP